MRLFVTTLLLLSAFSLQAASAKETLGKYQRLSLTLDKLCKEKAAEKDFVSSIRKCGGFHVIKGRGFVKPGAINFPDRIRLKILKDGNWDLVREEFSDDLTAKDVHFTPSSEYQLFVFRKAKSITPSEVDKKDRPLLVVFMPEKVIAIVTEDDRYYQLLNRQDHEFADITFKNRNSKNKQAK